MQQKTLNILYITLYFLLGSMSLIVVFGFTESMELLVSSPFDGMLSGPLIIGSALLGSIIVLGRYKHKLQLQPYPYFMLGFYTANLSLLLMFVLDADQVQILL